MTEISYDGQSFIVAGRRVWLVSGAIHYARTPHQLWRSRIRAAKQAGLNCIDTYVFWNLHEPSPGQFNFEGDLDLQKFIQMIGEEGMHCILRPGPYVGSGWDFGGLPAWLHRIDAVRLRQANGPFLESSSRYLGAVLEQVKDLQASMGGPILLMGAENRWFCDHADQAQAYLLEICRYLRENGCTVPIIDCNNLWSTTEGTLACWSGSKHLAADLRQLRVVQPHAPRVIIEYESGNPDHWGTKHDRGVDAPLHLYRLANILAVGGQYSILPFHGGTNHGFFAGQSATSRGAFVTTSHDCDAPLAEAGGRGPKYLATKRISVFASQFSHLFAHLHSHQHHAAVSANEDQDGMSLLHQSGPQGHVAFLFKHRKDPTRLVDVLLPNGLSLPVPLGDDQVAWFVLDADLGGMAKLDFTNLRPWAFYDRRVLVLFGPAGAKGLVSINDTLLRINVPSGQTPAIEQHDNLTVVVLNTHQVDAAYLGPNGIVVGTSGLDQNDQPLPLKGWASTTTIGSDGKATRNKLPATKRRVAPRLGKWQQTSLSDMVQGTSQNYQPIEGPASLESLGCDYGYGWYRLSSKSSVSGKMLAPGAADRLHLYQNSKLVKILGDGPAASFNPTSLRLAADTVVLADNLGRRADGWGMGEHKGLFDHFYCVKLVKLKTPKIITGTPPDLFDLGGFFPFAHHVPQSVSSTLVWTIRPTGKNPMILEIDRLPWRTMVLVNDTPIGAYDFDQSSGFARFTMRVGQELQQNRTNVLKLALLDPVPAKEHNDKALSKYLRLYQATASATAKAAWSFANWTLPKQSDFKPLQKSDTELPCWYRCQFPLSHVHVPMWFEPIGMTKGQLYINGHNAGRYFVNTHKGQAVGPQMRYYLPEPWLHCDGSANELLVFDEHGRNPGKCKLVYDASGPWGR